jgi:putative nucleotidyltransferase with HDIG domain
MSAAAVTDLSERLEELPELLPFPAVALKLLEACRDENTGSRDLCHIIECDASISMRLLRIANSSLYGCSGKIRTIEHAAVVLGVKGLRDLAVSAAAADVFGGDQDPESGNQRLWHHSIGCATLARILAEQVPHVAPDEAFVAGLVHDIGKLVFVELLREQYDLIPRALCGVSTVQEELRDYGLSHAELGERCGEEWGLPGEISDAIASHHCPADAQFAEELASVVGAANQVSKIWNVGSSGDVDQDIRQVFDEHGLAFDQATIELFREQAQPAYEASVKAFGA